MQNETTDSERKVKGISLRVLVVLGISAIFLAILFFLTNEIVLENETSFDISVFNFLDRFRSPGATSVFTFFTFFGSINFLLPAYILLSLYFIFFKKNNARSFNIAAIGLSSGLLLRFVKNIFQRHRPPNPLIENVSGFSFPSGHSFSSFTFVGVIIYMLWESKADVSWKWAGTAVLFILATIIAFSRVYLQVHYASDVIAGFCLSFVWLSLCIFILKRINLKGKITKNAVE
jgi:membrane-associated phospholipid phosphatase